MHRASHRLLQVRQVVAGNGKADMLESRGPLLLLPPQVDLAQAALVSSEQGKKSVRRSPLHPLQVELAHCEIVSRAELQWVLLAWQDPQPATNPRHLPLSTPLPDQLVVSQCPVCQEGHNLRKTRKSKMVPISHLRHAFNEAPRHQLLRNAIRPPVRIAMPVGRSKEPAIEAPEERHEPPALPTGIGRNVPDEEDLTEEPTGHDPARGAGAAMAEASFGANAPTQHHGSSAGGKRALVQYDYEKAEDNELELVEGEYVTNIEMVDDDWWMGTNQKGESGLFPSNYVELVEGEEEEASAPISHAPEPVAPPQAPRPAAEPAAPAAQASSEGPTAKALYDYEAAEDNELSFPEEATISGLVCPFIPNFGESANI